VITVTMTLYLVRHAHAGSRSAWGGDDRLRPLSDKGRHQAAAIRDRLIGNDVGRLISSQAIRCIETLQPLATTLGVPLDSDVRVAEGATRQEAWSLVEEIRDERQSAVICTHGDVVPEVLLSLRAYGAVFRDDLTWPKASIWAVLSNGATWTQVDYLPPPDLPELV
jgi:8-oxo-dGTP diphosphatase